MLIHEKLNINLKMFFLLVKIYIYTKEYVHTTHDVIHPKNKYRNNTYLISSLATMS